MGRRFDPEDDPEDWEELSAQEDPDNGDWGDGGESPDNSFEEDRRRGLWGRKR